MKRPHKCFLAPFRFEKYFESVLRNRQSLGSQNLFPCKLVGFQATSLQGDRANNGIQCMGKDDVNTGLKDILGLYPRALALALDQTGWERGEEPYILRVPSENFEQLVLLRQF